MFPGDLPRQDHPLPKALDDATAAKLLRAACDNKRLLVRVTEMLRLHRAVLRHTIRTCRAVLGFGQVNGRLAVMVAPQVLCGNVVRRVIGVVSRC